MPMPAGRGKLRAFVACVLASLSLFAFADSTLTETEKVRVIDGALARIHERYIEPKDIPAIDAALRSKAAKGGYRALTSPEAFADQLQEDLRKTSGDPHFRVSYVPGEIPPLPTGIQPSPKSEAERQAMSRAEAVIRNNGFTRVEHLEGNVGLVVLTTVSNPAMIAETAAATMSFVKDTSALILDMRQVRGGDPDGVAFLLSYFVEGRLHAFDLAGRRPQDTFQYFTDPTTRGPRYPADRPVFVLTSGTTFSGGEALVDALRTWRHAKVVGERTKGGANATLPMKAADHFTVGVPFLKTVNVATGKNWNIVGIEPDIAAPADKAQDVAYVLALEHIVATTKSDAWREQVRAMLQNLTSSR
ncbi:MAG: S41 family peptidase [Gammaproteobacteria bacterium]